MLKAFIVISKQKYLLYMQKIIQYIKKQNITFSLNKNAFHEYTSIIILNYICVHDTYIMTHSIMYCNIIMSKIYGK